MKIVLRRILTFIIIVSILSSCTPHVGPEPIVEPSFSSGERVVRSMHYDASGALTLRVETVYDDSGMLTERNYFDASSAQTYYTILLYDQNLINYRHITYDMSDTVIEELDQTFSDGLIVRQDNLTNPSAYSLFTYTNGRANQGFTYNSAGTLMADVTFDYTGNDLTGMTLVGAYYTIVYDNVSSKYIMQAYRSSDDLPLNRIEFFVENGKRNYTVEQYILMTLF